MTGRGAGPAQRFDLRAAQRITRFHRSLAGHHVEHFVQKLFLIEVEQFLLARLDAAADTAAFVERADLYVTLAAAASDPAAMSGLALRVLELAPQVRDKKATREEKALARRCDKLLGRTEAA